MISKYRQIVKCFLIFGMSLKQEMLVNRCIARGNAKFKILSQFFFSPAFSLKRKLQSHAKGGSAYMYLPAVAEELSLHRCLEVLTSSRLNVLTTKLGASRQNILYGSFCQAAALMRPGPRL
jgi:hypothetical protein